MDSKAIRILIVDDHALLRIGLASLFATVPSFTVVGEAADAATAVEQIRQQRPDIVLLDVRLPDLSGVEVCRTIRSDYPETRVVMLTSFADDEAVLASIMAGAAGYVLKQVEPEHLIDALRTVAEGGSLLDPAVTRTVFDRVRNVETRTANDPLAQLSEHERRLLPLIAAGRTNREIAAELYLSEHTVKTYISDILRKLRLSRRAEAASFITRQGIGMPPP